VWWPGTAAEGERFFMLTIRGSQQDSCLNPFRGLCSLLHRRGAPGMSYRACAVKRILCTFMHGLRYTAGLIQRSI